MSDRDYYLKKKADPQWLERKRERDRENKRRQRQRDVEAARRKAKEWRDKNKGKIAEYNRHQWEKIKADADKLERERRRRRVENMPADQVQKKRAQGRARSLKLTREAWASGTTRYEQSITPEVRERDTEKMRRWRAENIDHVRRKGREYTQRYRDKRGARAAIDTYAYKAIRMALVAADAKSKYFPGFTGKELKAHILSQLPNGWTIADYGEKWEIDHIIPRSAFDYQSYDDEEYRRCWSLENLRPCCKIENRRKGGIRGMF